jgi:hypothetical protein
MVEWREGFLFIFSIFMICDDLKPRGKVAKWQSTVFTGQTTVNSVFLKLKDLKSEFPEISVRNVHTD